MQLGIDRQHIVEAFPAPIDQVAQGDDEMQVLELVEVPDSLGEFPEARLVIAIVRRLEPRVLRVGNHAEPQDRQVGGINGVVGQLVGSGM